MSWRNYLLLFLLSLGILLVVASFQSAPGYMDAEYYFAGGLRLANGEGFSELFLWNYLDDPAGLPHPSHSYWMPLASILAFLSLKLGDSFSFSAGRSGFILVAACLSPLTASMAYRFTPRRDAAWLAGILALLPTFYLAYLPTSDTFGLYMVLGGLWLLTAAGPVSFNILPSLNFSPCLLGLISGLMHLARADGLVWLGLSLLAALWLDEPTPSKVWQIRGRRSLACLLGYMLVMGPWLLRNQVLFGSLLSPGGGSALWFVTYNDLYAYPANLLTFERWWESGVASILNARLWALGQNLLSFLVVQGEIFLAPLIILGLWRLRAYRSVRMGTLAWALILAIMSLVFPFAGARGGFFHSAAAVQTLFWAAVPAGLDSFVEWGRRRRSWKVEQARRFFQVGVISLALVLSIVILKRRVIGTEWGSPIWNETQTQYVDLGKVVGEAGMRHGEITMVNNPPGYYLATREPSIAIPDGGVSTLLAAGRKYGARYVLLESNHPDGLDGLYNDPKDRPGLNYLKSSDDAHLFEIIQESTTGEDG